MNKTCPTGFQSSLNWCRQDGAILSQTRPMQTQNLDVNLCPTVLLDFRAHEHYLMLCLHFYLSQAALVLSPTHRADTHGFSGAHKYLPGHRALRSRGGFASPSQERFAHETQPTNMKNCGNNSHLTSLTSVFINNN